MKEIRSLIRSNGLGKLELGILPNPRSAQAPWPSRRSQHDSENSQGPRDQTGAPAPHLLAYFLESPPRRNRRSGLLHNGGLDHAGTHYLLRPLPRRHCHSHRPRRWVIKQTSPAPCTTSAKSFIIATVACWINERQTQRIEFLCKQLEAYQRIAGTGRLPFTDKERRQLAVLGKALGIEELRKLPTLVQPETIRMN